MNEVIRRIAEFASLLSCLLNVIMGTGDREITLSAGGFELRRQGAIRGELFVWLIDLLPFNGEGHCEEAWYSHRELFEKVRMDAEQAT